VITSQSPEGSRRGPLGVPRALTGAIATLTLVLAVLVVLVFAAGAAPARAKRGPLARAAQATTDCDHDGDSPLGVEFEECGTAPPEPGKTFSPAEKAQAGEQEGQVRKLYLTYCGSSLSDPLTYLVLLTPLVAPCTEASIWIEHLKGLVADPPESAVSLVALPAVQASTGPASTEPKRRCTFGAATCRRGGVVASAYEHALEQESAAAGALATTLNRLSATPSGPESQFGSSPGAFPTYSRRTQVAASRLYSGLLAAWSDRLNAARANFVHFLDGLGSKAKRAAAKTPPGLPSKLLWKTYHGMNVYEIGQLYLDLETQTVEEYIATHPGSQPSGTLAAALTAGKNTLDEDMYQLYLASNGSGAARARGIAAAGAKFSRDADNFAAIPGLAAIAPEAPLSARLFGFAVEGLTRNKPKPPTAP